MPASARMDDSVILTIVLISLLALAGTCPADEKAGIRLEGADLIVGDVKYELTSYSLASGASGTEGPNADANAPKRANAPKLSKAVYQPAGSDAAEVLLRWRDAPEAKGARPSRPTVRLPELPEDCRVTRFDRRVGKTVVNIVVLRRGKGVQALAGWAAGKHWYMLSRGDDMDVAALVAFVSKADALRQRIRNEAKESVKRGIDALAEGIAKKLTGGKGKVEVRVGKISIGEAGSDSGAASRPASRPSTPAEAGKPQRGETTALHRACRKGHTSEALKLIRRGAAIDAGDGFRRTPLLLAVRQGHRKVVAALLDADADTSLQDAFDQGPLHAAAMGGRAGIARLLLAAGAKAEAKGRFDRTPLMLAAKHGHAELVRLLLDRGADPAAQDTFGDTAADLAGDAGHKQLLPLLTRRPPAEGGG